MQRKIKKTSLLKSYLIEINPTDYQSDPDKIDFLGVYAKPDYPVKLRRSTNKIKVDELLRALKHSTCWERPIFNDSHLPYYAITAYLQDKITREQISHILEFYELKATYPAIITVPILTRAGNFTHASKEYFAAIVRCQRSNLPNVTTEHLEKFKLALLDYRKVSGTASCVLHVLPIGVRHVGISSELGCIDSCELGDVFTPGPMRNIFYPAITPKNSTKTRSIGALGKFSIDTIEKGYRNKVRIHALGFPGAFRTTKAHGFNVTLADVTGHDAIHQGAISYFPEQLYHLCLHCLDVIRNITNIKWSAELWPFIDMFVIDTHVSVLNQKKGPDDHAFARTYAPNEALSDAQCQLWFINFLQYILSDSLFNIVLVNMIQNKDEWQQWIEVDNFVTNNASQQFIQALQKPLTLNQILQQENIHQQINFGFVLKWLSITDSILNQLIHFKKNSDNKIYLYLFGKPISNYSDMELKALLMDIEQGNLLGIELVNAAASDNIEQLAKLSKSIDGTKPFDYLLLALKVAAKHGHDQCVETILLNDKINSKSQYFLDGLEDAATSGHKQCLKLLLDKVDACQMDSIIQNTLRLAVKNRQPEIVDFILEQKQYISQFTLARIAATALDHDDRTIAIKIFLYAANNNKLHEILKDLNIYLMLRNSPKNCLSTIIEIFIGHSDLTYQTLFTAIAKLGSIECANEFIDYINKQEAIDEIQKNEILMECMLAGFSSVAARNYFTQPVNLHHEMVKLQINQYLKSSSFNDLIFTQYPKKTDIEKLLDKIFSPSLTACDLVLHHLIRHPLIKDHASLNAYCLSLAINKALLHTGPHYLRLLLRAGVTLNFSQVGEDVAVDGLLIKNIPASEVKCLAWLARAFDEIQKYQPNVAIIKQCILNSALEHSFEREMYTLVYSNSLPISLHTLRHLSRCLSDDEKFANVKQLITERIEFLQDNDLQLTDKFNLAMFNKPNILRGLDETFFVYEKLTPDETKSVSSGLRKH